MNLRSCFLPTALVAAAILPLQAGRGPSTPEERARVLKLAEASPTDALRLMATEGRWFAKWMEEVPDFSFGPEAPARWMEGAVKGDLRRVAIFLYEVGGMAYQIRHQVPDARKAPEHLLPTHTAALENVVRAYAAMRDLKPENRSPKLDEALQRLEAGTFPAFVAGLFPGKRG
jgi:hypothetical protein